MGSLITILADLENLMTGRTKFITTNYFDVERDICGGTWPVGPLTESGNSFHQGSLLAYNATYGICKVASPIDTNISIAMFTHKTDHDECSGSMPVPVMFCNQRRECLCKTSSYAETGSPYTGGQLLYVGRGGVFTNVKEHEDSIPVAECLGTLEDGWVKLRLLTK